MRRAQLRVGRAAAIEQRHELRLDVRRALARQRAPLELDRAPGGVARRLVATLDPRGVHGRAAEQRVGPPPQRRVELAQRRQDRARLDDRVDAEVRARAVRGAPLDLDPRPLKALVRDDELELGRLGDDGRVGAHRREHLLDAEACVLLVGDGGHDDVTAQAERRRLPARDQRGRHARLHVVRAAAVQAVALDARIVRRLHPRDPDGVDVTAQQQRAPAPGARRAHDDARAPRRRLEHAGLEARGERPAVDERRDLALARPAAAGGRERRVDRVDRDELAQEVDDPLHVSEAARA